MADKIGRIVPRFGGRSLKSSNSKEKASKATPVKVTNPVKIASEDDWRARDDASTIARASAIKADPQRMAAAAKEASKMAQEKAAELRGLRSITRRSK